MNEKKYQIIEAKDGILHMFVWDTDGSIFFSAPIQPQDVHAYIFNIKYVDCWNEDLSMLCKVADALKLSDPQEAARAYYSQLIDAGSSVIADESGIYVSRMGYAGRKAFNIDAV